MLSQLSHMGLELNVHGLPKWMAKMNPDKMNSKQRHHVVCRPATPFPLPAPLPLSHSPLSQVFAAVAPQHCVALGWVAEADWVQGQLTAWPVCLVCASLAIDVFCAR